MKKKMTALCGLLLFVSGITKAQQSTTCTSPNAYTTIHGNNIRAGILNAGDLFWDLNDPQFIPNPTPNGPNPSTIFAAGLWLGGVDPAGNLKLATSTYRDASADITDYWAGPLDDQGIIDAFVCPDWDKLFKVKGADIKAFLDDLPTLVNNPALALAAYKSIMGWPGKGNPYFLGAWGFDLPVTLAPLAPFFDTDQDGIYNPLAGDYPVVQLRNKAPFVPAEIVWCVFNDEGGGAEHSASFGATIHAEVQLTVWAFKCPNESVLNNAVFTSHKIINRAAERIDSFFVGLWVDFDLGCRTDDYMGCAPDLDAFFAYNQDAIDGTNGILCDQGVPTFADTSPVQSVTFLSRPMDKFVYYNDLSVGNWPAGTTDPDLPSEYYNYLTGRWKDGSPLTYGGDGYQESVNTDFAFPDDPVSPNGWSMCSANLAFADRRVLASSKIGTLVPGAIEELVAAWTVHPKPNLPCGVGTTYADIAFLRSEFENNFPNACSGLISAAQEPRGMPVGIFPNPAAETVTLQYGDLPVREIRLFAADGRLVHSLQNIHSEQTVLDVASLKNGVYAVQLLTERGSVVRKISVLK